MASSTSSESKFQLLSATYHSPTNKPFVHTHKIPAPPSSKTSDRTTYLAALRAAAAGVQEAINCDLTARMEEDKAREGPMLDTKKVVKEAEEEDNYGEEVVEED